MESCAREVIRLGPQDSAPSCAREYPDLQCLLHVAVSPLYRHRSILRDSFPAIPFESSSDVPGVTGEGPINTAIVMLLYLLSHPHTLPIGIMARSPIPKPIQANIAHPDCSRRQEARSARGMPPPRYPRSQFGDSFIETDYEFEYEDESVRGVWNQVRFGGRCANKIDLRTCEQFSFWRMKNFGRTVSSRAASCPYACTRAVTPPHLI